MALLKIARMGHPVLKAPASPVEDPTSPEVAALAADMIETMYDAGGTGLAAPQVYVSARMVVYFVDSGRDAREGGSGEGVPLTVMINPQLEPVGDEIEPGWEGCLSIPGMMGEVPRHTHIRYKYQDLQGNTVEGEARGFHARVLQHECDHLDGILYPYRIEDLTRFGFTEELARAAHDEHSDAEDQE